MNVGAVTLSRFRELVKNRAVGMVDWVEARKGVKQGIIRVFCWIVLLYAVFQSEVAYVGPLIIMFGTSFLYMSIGRVHRFWVAAGLTVGAFLTALIALPLIRTLELLGVHVGRLLARHLGDEPIFFGWDSVMWITAMIGIPAFLPYGFSSARALWKQHKDWSWARQEVMPEYRAGRRFSESDPSQTPLERDEIAQYWAGLSLEDLEDRAVIVAMRLRCKELMVLAELQKIHYRSVARLKSDRYQQRHKQ